MNRMKGGQFASGTLTAGNAVTVSMAGAPVPATVWVRPASGDTVAVSYSTDDGATFTAWPNGSVTSTSNDSLIAPVTHVQFQRTAGTGTTSAWGIC